MDNNNQIFTTRKTDPRIGSFFGQLFAIFSNLSTNDILFMLFAAMHHCTES
jgi:hypothetical protein